MLHVTFTYILYSLILKLSQFRHLCEIFTVTINFIYNYIF